MGLMRLCQGINFWRLSRRLELTGRLCQLGAEAKKPGASIDLRDTWATAAEGDVLPLPEAR